MLSVKLGLVWSSGLVITQHTAFSITESKFESHVLFYFFSVLFKRVPQFFYVKNVYSDRQQRRVSAFHKGFYKGSSSPM